MVRSKLDASRAAEIASRGRTLHPAKLLRSVFLRIRNAAEMSSINSSETYGFLSGSSTTTALRTFGGGWNDPGSSVMRVRARA